jgi:hypothetical protein
LKAGKPLELGRVMPGRSRDVYTPAALPLQEAVDRLQGKPLWIKLWANPLPHAPVLLVPWLAQDIE